MTDTKVDRARIIERIRRCLALGDKSRNPSEAEAETAIRMAKNLMAQYNLSMEEVATQDGPTEAKKITQEVGRKSALPRWEQDLPRVCDALFATYHFFRPQSYPSQSTGIVFCGEEVGVLLAVEVFKLLRLEIFAMSKRWADRDPDCMSGLLTTAGIWSRRFAYMEGMVWTLLRRAQEEADNLSKEQAAKSTAIIIRKANDAKEWATKEFGLVSRSSRFSETRHGDAQSDGARDGKKLSLDFRKHVRTNTAGKPLQLGSGS